MMNKNKRSITATEQKRWEELNKIRSLPIPIAEKRAMKAKLTNLPVVELSWKNKFNFNRKRIVENVIRRWKQQTRTHVIWQRSLQDIEVRGGTSIVNVFIFIKWTVFFNMFIFLVVFAFVILPYVLANKKLSSKASDTCPPNYNPPDNATALRIAMNQTTSSFVTDVKQLSDCCVTKYYEENDHVKDESFWQGFNGAVTGWDQIDFTFSPMTYGYYTFHEFRLQGLSYRFQQAYVLVPIAIFILSLVSMVGQIGVGIKELTLAKEGEFYKFSNLIFAGWDHYTKDEAGASFKKKILKNEMKIALRTEKLKVKSMSKRQQLRLFVKRVLANVLVIVVMILIGIIIYYVADFSIKQSLLYASGKTDPNRIKGLKKDPNRIRRYGVKLLPSLVIAIFNLIFPVFLKRIIRKLERYSHEVNTALTLIRCLVVRVLAIAFAAIKYYAEEYCEKSPGSCNVCLNETVPHTGLLRDKDYCWESIFGVHIYLIILVDFVVKVLVVFVIGYGKVLLGKLTKIRSLQEVTKFNIIRHSLDIIYIQCLSWFFYFAPFLPFFVTIYCILVGYMKKFNLMFLSQAVPDTFRTTRTTTVYVMTKALAFIVATLTIGFVLTSLEPSRSCGPFRGLNVPWDAVAQIQSPIVARTTSILLSPGIGIPVVVIFATLCYYYYNASLSHKRMVDTLRHMLILEGHDKQYLFERMSALRQEAAAILESEKQNNQP